MTLNVYMYNSECSAMEQNYGTIILTQKLLWEFSSNVLFAFRAELIFLCIIYVLK